MNTSTKATATQLLTVSPEFKREASKSIISIVAFILVYLLLIAASIGIFVLSVYGGIGIIYLRPSFYTLLFGLGLVGFGIMVFVFLIKFLFTTSKNDNSNSIQITEQDEPRLFEMIESLAKEAGTPAPKKVFLTPDVNAAVFYNSSFWSMFLPIRKNLNIGLGLVNAVNVSELKAVIAHEFGHFSQRSMKLGSWVYQVNRIIYDMLYNNQGYANSIGGMSQAHAIFSLFAALTVKVVQGIQWVLRQMFEVVNKSYLGLSRQMEFHADLVAASICGSNNIINALRRAEFADVCYNATIDLCNEAWRDKKVVQDFYTDHRIVVSHLAKRNRMSLIEGLPVIEQSTMSGVTNRINYKNQWASHPALTERNEYLKPFGLTAGVDHRSAWTLFDAKGKWNELLTQKIYTAIPKAEVQGVLTEEEFENLVIVQDKKFSFPEVFKEYYDSRFITAFDVEAAVKQPFLITTLDQVLTEEGYLLPKKIEILAQDVAILNSIIKKEIQTRSFDFDGQKYDRKEASAILAQLEAEHEQKQNELKELDQRLFRFFYAIAPLAQAESLKQCYHAYFDQRSKGEAYIDKVNRFMNILAPIFRGETISIDTINRMIANFKAEDEPAFKKELKYWLLLGTFDNEPTLKEDIQKFLAADYQYFFEKDFLEGELNDLSRLAQESWNCIHDQSFQQFKSISEVQADLLQAAPPLMIDASSVRTSC
ncbi:MAG TPA: M48 family metallopeptidase [Chitinophagaceae bacterium]|nr:M48 family metallopeptidase [Chitinophagaceae bacterium]